MIKDTILRQYIYEIRSWLRLLTFFTEENIYFKTRLAEIVDNGLAKEILDYAEKFHDRFLKQDKTITILSDELHQQTKLLQRDLLEDGILFKKVLSNQKKLRKEIKGEEEIFNTMKEEFTNFFSPKFIES